MRVSRLSVVVASALLIGALTPVETALADPVPPSVTIVTPTNGSSAEGPITVTATGQLDPAAMDTASNMSLVVDTTLVLGSTVDCTGQADPATSCAYTYTYDPAGLAPGPHNLVVELQTGNEGFFDSAPVTVVVPGPPTVTMDPVSTPVTGPVTVGVTGNTDAASADTPASIQLDWGGAVIGSQTCPAPGQHSCPLSFQWDTTDENATHPLTATMTTVASHTASTSQAVVEARNPKPTVQITAPAEGENRSGVIQVTATASVVGPQADHPDSMELYVDSTSNPIPGQKIACTGGGPTCDATFTWDATGYSGSAQLIVGVHTARGKTNADIVTVNVTSPAPTVVISEPADNTTVFGLVTVKATGTVDPSQTDGGGSMALYVDNAFKTRVDCPAGRSCPATLTWDASGINGNRTLRVVYTTGGGRSVSDSTNVRVTTTPPTASISAPANGATISGPVTVVTNGAINAKQNDSPASMQLLVDGAAVSAAQACSAAAATPKACSVPFVWDTTGLTGTHTLQASFRTQKGFTALSAVSTVTVVSPAPAARIVSPAVGLTVHRTATIKATGAIDPSQNDAPSSMRLTLDGAPLGGPLPCAPAAATPKTCTVSYTWSTKGLTGRHTLAATLVSTRGASGTSAASAVYVYGGTKLVITPAKAQRAGRAVTYTGRVTTLINRLGAPGVRVKVLLRPARGKAKTVYVRTNALGYFKVAFKPSMNTTVEATVAPVAYYGTSHSFAKLKVVPVFKCSVGKSVRRNRLDQGVCRVANLPATTKVSLQYQFAGRWYSLGAGKARGPVIPFSFRFAHGGIFHVRVVLSATSVFAAATGPALKVSVT